MIPTCMTDEELADWNRLNTQARTRLINSTPCEDCTDLFAAEMRAVGLCNGFPGPQRYCATCLRWWPDDEQHWATRLRRACCLVCRRRRQAATRYLRDRRNPARWAAVLARHRRSYATRMLDPSFRARENARDSDNKRTRYQTDPEYRERVLARNRAARVKP